MEGGGAWDGELGRRLDRRGHMMMLTLGSHALGPAEIGLICHVPPKTWPFALPLLIVLHGDGALYPAG